MRRRLAQRGPAGALGGAVCLLLLSLFSVVGSGCEKKQTLEAVTAATSVETQGGLTATRIPGTAAGSGATDPKQRPLALGAARLASTFAPQGRPLFAPVSWRFEKAGRKDLPVTLKQGMRVAFLAYGQPASLDLDLLVSLPDGLAAAEDRSPDEMPVITHFEVPRDGIYNLRATADGPGEALLMGFEEATVPETFAARNLAALAKRYLGGALPLSPVHRESLLPGHSARLAFAAVAGRCYGVVAIGSEKLRDLDLYWATAESEELEEDTGPAADVVIPKVCMDHAGMTTVTLRAAEGSGDAFWQVYEHAERRQTGGRAEVAIGSGNAEK
jgi:hypothetical protein